MENSCTASIASSRWCATPGSIRRSPARRDMPSTVLDSDIFKDIFGTPEMRAVFSDDNLLQCYVAAEVALAVAQGRTGVIPREAAEAIARLAPAVVLDRALLKQDAENIGYPIAGLVRQLSGKLGDAGRYLHWGATTQDIADT